MDSDNEQSTASSAKSDAQIIGSGGAVGQSYELTREIDRGATGIVYEARQRTPLHRRVAIKILKPGMDSDEVLARFALERQTLAMMDHPNIAKIFDAGVTSTGRPYFVMELIDGALPIVRYCDQQSLTIEQRVSLFIRVCRAIQYAHQKAILHRDIKPSNIVIASTASQIEPKVIDFGLAKAIDQGPDATVLTSPGAIVGTLRYMSPEQAGRSRAIDTRSDIYSLGAVLYQLLTGELPFSVSDDFLESVRMIREQDPLRPSERVKRAHLLVNHDGRTDRESISALLRGDLDSIVMKALAKSPSERYQSAEALANDLERYLHGEPVEARPPSATYRFSKFARKHRVGLGAGVALLTLLIGGTLVSTLFALRAQQAARRAEAVNSFLRNDLLAQADPASQIEANEQPDPNITVRVLLDRASNHVNQRFRSQPEIEVQLLETIGNAYRAIGAYREASSQFEQAVKISSQAFGDLDPNTLGLRGNLVDVYEALGEYEKGESLGKILVEDERRILGQDDRNTLAAMNNLAEIYEAEGRFREAESLLGSVVEGKRRVLGATHRSTLVSMANLAWVYEDENKYESAAVLQNQILAVDGQTLGPEHPTTLSDRNNLATTYHLSGRFKDAEEMYATNLRIQKRVLGPNHPHTIITGDNLARLHSDMGRNLRAEEENATALVKAKQFLGAEAPDTIKIINNSVRILVRNGKYSEAERVCLELLSLMEHAKRVDSPDAVVARANLADIYLYTNRLQAALQAQEVVVKELSVRNGKAHLFTLNASDKLAFLYLLLGRSTLAVSVLRDDLELLRNKFPERWERGRCEVLLGTAIAASGAFPESKELLISGYNHMAARRENIPVDSLPFIRLGGDVVRFIYSASKEQQEFAEWATKAQGEPQPFSFYSSPNSGVRSAGGCAFLSAGRCILQYQKGPQ